MIGFSLGGQAIGEMGLYLRRQGAQPVDECFGLDPAGGGFDGYPDDLRITKDDCRVVQVLHTNAGATKGGFLNALYGTTTTYYKSGNCDFWINCGHVQLGCERLDFEMLSEGVRTLLGELDDRKLIEWVETRICSHFRAPFVFLAAVSGACRYR